MQSDVMHYLVKEIGYTASKLVVSCKNINGENTVGSMQSSFNWWLLLFV